MRILALLKSCGEFFRLTGFKNVLESAGHTWVWWDQAKTSIFDMLDRLGNFDIFIGTTYDLNESIANALNEKPDMKLVLKGGDDGNRTQEVRDWAKTLTVPCPIVFAEDRDRFLVSRLVHKDIVIMCHYHPNRLNESMVGWEELGVKVGCIPNASDIFEYPLGEFREDLASDIAYVGGIWPYKALNITPYLHRILPSSNSVSRLLKGDLNIKIWGNQGWQLTPEFLGYPDNSLVKHIYRSAHVCPSFSEPHSTEFGYDVIERPFKILTSGGFCISDYVESMADDFFKGVSLPFFRNMEEFMDLVELARKDPESKEHFVQEGRRHILDNHTYFHRVAQLLRLLGLSEEAQIILDRWDILKEIHHG